MFKKPLFLFILFFFCTFSFAQSENAKPSFAPLDKGGISPNGGRTDKQGNGTGNFPAKKNNTDAIINNEGLFEDRQGKEVLDKDGKSLKSKDILPPEGNQKPQYPAGHKPIKISDNNCPVT